MKEIISKLKSERGSMDKVLVTLLLIIVTVAALVGLQQWNSTQKENLLNSSNTAITGVINENK